MLNFLSAGIFLGPCLFASFFFVEVVSKVKGKTHWRKLYTFLKLEWICFPLKLFWLLSAGEHGNF